jgi:hypothetical protein
MICDVIQVFLLRDLCYDTIDYRSFLQVLCCDLTDVSDESRRSELRRQERQALLQEARRGWALLSPALSAPCPRGSLGGGDLTPMTCAPIYPHPAAITPRCLTTLSDFNLQTSATRENIMI